MKKLLLLLFSLALSFNSYGEWTFVVESKSSDEYYIDFDRISNKNGYVYYWQLVNFPNPPYVSASSSKGLFEADCNGPYKERRLAYYRYESAMGDGPINSEQILTLNWDYIIPDTIGEVILDEVCEY